jgi:NAD-dependent deacetylase
VDDLHERAGSSNVLHLHGELLKVRSTKTKLHLDWQDLNFGDLDKTKSIAPALFGLARSSCA